MKFGLHKELSRSVSTSFRLISVRRYTIAVIFFTVPDDLHAQRSYDAFMNLPYDVILDTPPPEVRLPVVNLFSQNAVILLRKQMYGPRAPVTASGKSSFCGMERE
jgi:hypothetical protein